MKLSETTIRFYTNATMTSDQLDVLCDKLCDVEDKLMAYAQQLASELKFDVLVEDGSV